MRGFPGAGNSLPGATPCPAATLPPFSRDRDIPIGKSSQARSHTGAAQGPRRKKATFPKRRGWGGPRSGWLPGRALAAALQSGSVTGGAGWVEASESNSVHTYLMLVTVAETLRRVTELMRYLRKCIFFSFTKKKKITREGGETFDGVFSH